MASGRAILTRTGAQACAPEESSGAPPESPPHYFGVPCRAAKNAEQFAAALDWAFALKGPSVIEAFIDATAYSATVFD